MKTILFTITIASMIAWLTTGTIAAAGDVAAGKELFVKKCASCHGVNGEGKDAIAKMMKVEMKHLGSKEVQAKSDADLSKSMREGTGKMKPVADLKEKDLQDVVSFLRTLAKK